MSNVMDLTTLATQLDQATLRQEAAAQLTGQVTLDLATAYRVQAEGIRLREQRGERRVGLKLGFTSRAKMQQMGVEHLIWGELTDAMQIEEGGELDLRELIHPRVEPEIYFITRKEINSPLSLAEAGSVLEGVGPALEIIDSRYRDFRFTLEDVVADNCSSAKFVVGALQSPQRAIDNLGVVMNFNGRALQVGSTAAILGHPLRALVQIASLLHQQERTLPAGSVILAGAATAAEALYPRLHVSVDISGFGRTAFHTRGEL
ncbi:2-keto-4-pentenoate hydratase [Serratia oryzae]|uniref:4-oxalocrotonate decarboxylase n=1 Tax=Serratia oryzae TaxID=2034155 RepID=A0A1S8CMZ7_9GAMM|nr:fumarylacetoacetate hydrolase family protein [Serratia oryzae]OMQ25333.1 4-oxalocrotonate decarboxylase [Serratia oryzae]